MEKTNEKVLECLHKMQLELKAKKDKYNPFGKFNFRSAESMYENLKPLLEKYNCVLTFDEEPLAVGQFLYIKGTAVLTSLDDGSFCECSSCVRDGDARAGLSFAQGSGCCLSYLRKYVMCGMFLVDDGTDDDSISGKANKDKEIRDAINAATSLEGLSNLFNSLGEDLQEAYKPLFSIRKKNLGKK